MQKATPVATPSSPDSPFVVLLASPRTGTNLLKSILTTDSSIKDAGESFRPNKLDKIRGVPNFWKFLRDHKSMSKALILTVEERDTQWRAYLSFLDETIKTDLKILDFKYNMLRTADVGYLWPEEAPTMLRLAKKDGMPIIQLKRRNHLETFCSLQLALKTDEWIRKDEQLGVNKTGNVNSIRIYPAYLLKMLAAMQRDETLVDSWVAGYGRRIELIYEDLLRDGQLSGRAIESIERLLGRKVNISPQPRTLKISPPLDELIENYNEVETALAGTPYAAFLPQKAKPYNAQRAEHTTEPTLKNHDPTKKDIYPSAKILSSRPLITLLSDSENLRAFDALTSGAPEIFDTKRALHLLNLRWTLETGGARMLAGSIIKAQKLYPGHVFLPLTATDNDTFLLAQQGIPSLLASGLIFHDEKVWYPRADKITGLSMFDAIYVARLDPFKRHELAKGIDSLSLAYGYSLSRSQSDAYERVRNILPKAFFANHRLSDGGGLDHDLLCRLLGHARVGLCLSAEEGCMRASMEYLLAGLPVVSTPSIGGRDRYYTAPYCRVIEANPDALAAAVRDFAGKNLDRQRIRQHVAQMVGFDRYNFLLNVNKIAKHHLGQDELISSFAPMIGAIAVYSPTEVVVKAIRSEFASLHKS